jgi:hypothetical protein
VNIGDLINSGICEHRYDEIMILKKEFLDKLESKKWFLEIGVRYGGSSRCWQLCGFENGIGIEVDFSQLRCDLGNSYYKIEGHSWRLLDFLYIDGNHDYKSAKTDYELYSPFVREGGLIGFHDLMLNNPPEVVKVFREVSKDNKTAKEIVLDGVGIGAFFK